MERRGLKSKRKKILLPTRQTGFFSYLSPQLFTSSQGLSHTHTLHGRTPSHTHLSPSILALTAERNCDISDDLVVLSLSHTHTP